MDMLIRTMLSIRVDVAAAVFCLAVLVGVGLSGSAAAAPPVAAPSSEATTAPSLPSSHPIAAISDQTVAVAAPATRPATAGPIRVGVVLSHFTATGPSWVGPPYGYEWPTRILRNELLDSGFELCPIIEPGTAAKGELPALLAKYFPNKSPIECTDAAAMKSIEVFVVVAAANLTPEMIASLTTAVRDDGKGLLLRMFFGSLTPGHTDEVNALSGLRAGQYAYGQEMNSVSDVVADHPILGKLRVGDEVRVKFNGPYGDFAGQPLLVLAPGEEAMPVGRKLIRDRPDFIFSPLYVSALGKGRIVGCCWSSMTADEPHELSSDAITARAIRWLAGDLR